jgi:hypothetical protein
MKKNACFWVLGLLILSACGPSREEVIRQKVAQMVQDYRVKKSAECRASLLSEAEQIVDSLLLTEAQATLRDSLNRLRPAKPAEPIPIPPIDSLAVKPIFDR